MTEIVVDFSDSVKLENVRLGFVCTKCGHTWGVYLRNGRLPWGADECGVCKQNLVEKAGNHNGNKIEY